eukprot:gene11151-18770_t
MEDPGLLTTGMELNQLPGPTPSVFFLQQRAPAVKGRQAEFAASLMEWAATRGVSQIVVLCGLDAGLRADKQLQGAATRFLASDTSLAETCAAKGWTQLEHSFLEERGLPYVLLSAFVSEGDNLPDAMSVATILLELLSADPTVAPSISAARSHEGTPTAGGLSGFSPFRMPCSFATLYGADGRA